jgi:DNA-binding NarL/FixJ family response regulator
MNHFLIVEDEQDTLENLRQTIRDTYPAAKVSVAYDCDEGFRILNSSKVELPVNLLITDITFRRQPESRVIKNGMELLQKLLDLKYVVPRIVYSSHDELRFIHPVIKNYQPEGYVLKSRNSTDELLIAISRVLNHTSYFSQDVHESQIGRFEFDLKLDEIDLKIIEFLPNVNSIVDWDVLFEQNKLPIKYKSINKRLKTIFEKMDVQNEKQLLLKLQRLAIIE